MKGTVAKCPIRIDILMANGARYAKPPESMAVANTTDIPARVIETRITTSTAHSGEWRSFVTPVYSSSPSPFMLNFQTFSYRFPQLLISLGQVLNHPLLNWFVNVHKVGDEVIY